MTAIERAQKAERQIERARELNRSPAQWDRYQEACAAAAAPIRSGVQVSTWQEE